MITHFIAVTPRKKRYSNIQHVFPFFERKKIVDFASVFFFLDGNETLKFFYRLYYIWWNCYTIVFFAFEGNAKSSGLASSAESEKLINSLLMIFTVWSKRLGWKFSCDAMSRRI